MTEITGHGRLELEVSDNPLPIHKACIWKPGGWGETGLARAFMVLPVSGL